VRISRLVLLILIPALAQDRGLTIRGKITDESGALIAGVRVLVTNEAGFSRSAVAKEGEYSVTEIPPGRYRVVVGLPEFEPAVKLVDVTGSASGIVDLTLKPQVQFPLVGTCPGPNCISLDSFGEFVQPKDLKSELASMVQTEREFAARSVKSGTGEAFLANLSASSIIFRTNAVLGQLWFHNNPAPKGQLSWKPAFADISSAADFGYTTGPWEFRPSADQAVAASGQYVTVWERRPEGRWKIALDIGVSHEGAVAAADFVSATVGNAVQERRSSSQIESSRQELRQIEYSLFTSPEDYASAFAEDVRLYRDGKLPIVGSSAVAAARGEAGAFLWTVPSIVMSSSTDFAYVYGKAYFDFSSRHNYFRIWKRRPPAKWRIVVDLVD
jgi:hypothetical protein